MRPILGSVVATTQQIDGSLELWRVECYWLEEFRLDLAWPRIRPVAGIEPLATVKPARVEG